MYSLLYGTVQQEVINPWGDTPSCQGMWTRYKVVVEEQAFPKSSASPGLSGTFLAMSPWVTMTEINTGVTIWVQLRTARDCGCNNEIEIVGHPSRALVSLTLCASAKQDEGKIRDKRYLSLVTIVTRIMNIQQWEKDFHSFNFYSLFFPVWCLEYLESLGLESKLDYLKMWPGHVLWLCLLLVEQ